NLPDSKSQKTRPVQGAIVQQSDGWFAVMDVFLPDESSRTNPSYDPQKIDRSVVLSGVGKVDPDAVPKLLASALNSPETAGSNVRLQADGNTVIDVAASSIVPSSSSGGIAKTSQLPKPGKSRYATVLWTGVSVGLAANLMTIAAGAYMLYDLPQEEAEILAKATQEYEAGNFQQAIILANSIEARETIAQWQKDWQAASFKFVEVERSFSRGEWQAVLRHADEMPNLDVWQQKLEPMVKDSLAQLEIQGEQWVQQAYDLAAQDDYAGALQALQQIPRGTKLYTQIKPKLAEYQQQQQLKREAVSREWVQYAYDLAALGDFTGALDALQQVPEGTALHAKIQPKLAEYQEKQQIKREVEAHQWVEEAYRLAAVGEFDGALSALQEVPPDTTLYAKIQPKFSEYQKKQRLQQETIAYQSVREAYALAGKNDFTGALTALERVPSGTAAFDRIGPKLEEYRQKQEIRAKWMLKQASDRARAGKINEAIAFLEEVPYETSVYSLAQTKIWEYSQK
ncbi:hypothetical protein IQ235_10705, partial [Oscillatoriales cyanobacterium LEGE 11467]|nr:hypothetical protein [Zarconia navalis LEGE 11467]